MIEEFYMNERRDIILKTAVTPTEYAAIRNRREAVGLSESAYLRLLALQDAAASTRRQLLNEHGLTNSPEIGQF
jgi:hypothetical protein